MQAKFHAVWVMLWSRWDAFSAAVGPRRYVIGAVVAVVIGFVDWFSAQTGFAFGVPSWIAAIIVILTLNFFWLLEYIVLLRRRIRGARFDLAKLRAVGVKLRNQGRSISTDAELEYWEKQTLVWNDEVIKNIRAINEADAEWFSILDTVPAARIPLATSPAGKVNAHFKAFCEHDFRVKRLGKMIYRIWER